ncbi:hypothetical protein BE61_45500 [Bradyrhizobium elkanii USDA 61]|nr:hypothetical protein BE61_45500 [Bradyrhizobium elkanii USDA 61]
MVAGAGVAALPVSAASAGAAITDMASSAAEIVFSMMVLLVGIERFPAGWSASPINARDLRGRALNPF